MPKEILWEILPRGNNWFEGTIQEIRFRRPQLIKTEDILSVFRERLRQVKSGSQIVINEEAAYEQTEKRPRIILGDEKELSLEKSLSFPLKIGSADFDGGKTSLCIAHNVPLEEKPLIGSCTWFNFTQPLTGIGLKISLDCWYDWKWQRSRKKRIEARAIFNLANGLYWFFQEWVNTGELVKQLSRKGYDLKPQFDPSWTNCVVEDQCQECGEIHATLPHKFNQIKVGKISRNYCHCRWKNDYRYHGGIERHFRIIGAYPISPEEAEVALCEGSLQADSAD